MIQELKICSVSGGKDSTALYCLMVEYYGNNFLPIFADTGNEHPVTINYVRNLHIMAGGPKVNIVKSDFSKKLSTSNIQPKGNPFLDLMLWKRRAPSTKAQFCTEWLKLWPQLIFLQENYPTNEWIMFSGIRQGESLRRFNTYKNPFTYNTYFDCDYILPLLYETEERIFEFLNEKGVPPNPLYALGYGRVGCFPCIHANKNELSFLPDWAWDKLEYWENCLGRSFFSAGKLPKGFNYIPTVQDVRNWCKTVRGGKQYDLFKTIDLKDAPACMSTWGICE